MYDKTKYVHRKWRQVVIPLVIAALFAASYILIALTDWLFGSSDLVHGDLFKFCLILLGFSVFFYGFLRIIKSIVLSRIS
jgi:hypothetical protein